MKGGFSTLNRWFGRKKGKLFDLPLQPHSIRLIELVSIIIDKSGVGNAAANGKLSKSTTQLHHLSTDTGMHINEASQLEYNRITPLPAATSNAPFEQTFRITVLLPKDQLYVTRLGARVPLSKLLSLVCDNKQLDADKYEFRNPGKTDQYIDIDSMIGIREKCRVYWVYLNGNSIVRGSQLMWYRLGHAILIDSKGILTYLQLLLFFAIVDSAIDSMRNTTNGTERLTGYILMGTV